MTPNNDITATPTRAQQQDARAWAKFTGCNYTSALRQMRSPLAQGLLGERVSARQLIRTLEEHELVGADPDEFVLGENGYYAERPFAFGGETDFIQLVLITEVLRMFAPASAKSAPKVFSYSLKHTVERLLGEHDLAYSYVSNGRLIWAAASLGLRLSTRDAPGDGDDEGPNLWVGISGREYEYVDRIVRSGVYPGGHRYRPARYDRLHAVLPRAFAGEIITETWAPPARDDAPAPFHDWLARQVDRDDPVSDLANDYTAGIYRSEHDIARTPGDMLTILSEFGSSPSVYDAAVKAITEYMQTEPMPEPFRTRKIETTTSETEGYGAGAGTIDRTEYLCPCGVGEIIETRDNIPGFRDRDVSIDCDRCSTEWRLDYSGRTWSWELVPRMRE